MYVDTHAAGCPPGTQTSIPTQTGQLRPRAPGLSRPDPAAPEGGGQRVPSSEQAWGVLLPAARPTVRQGHGAAPPWPLPEQKWGPPHPPCPGTWGRGFGVPAGAGHPSRSPHAGGVSGGRVDTAAPPGLTRTPRVRAGVGSPARNRRARPRWSAHPHVSTPQTPCGTRCHAGRGPHPQSLAAHLELPVGRLQ